MSKGKINITSLARKMVRERNKKQPSVNLIGPPEVSIDKVKDWADKNGGTREFINLASLYYKYGNLTGIRPEILYAQAAKSTKFGRFNNNVPPYFHNPSDLQIDDAAEEGVREAYQRFPNWDAGVRAHFNTVCAFTGLPPVGDPGDLYHDIINQDRQGEITTVEDLFLDPGSYKEFRKNYLDPLSRL